MTDVINSSGLRSYRYGKDTFVGRAAGLMFGASALGLSFMATFNTKGLSFGIVSFSPGAATLVWWGMAMALAFAAAALVLPTFSKEGKVVDLQLEDDGLLVPFETGADYIRYDDMDEILVVDRTGEKAVLVRHLNGALELLASAMESPAMFEEFLGELRYRARFSAAA